jgi:hypothetical protein
MILVPATPEIDPLRNWTSVSTCDRLNVTPALTVTATVERLVATLAVMSLKEIVPDPEMTQLTGSETGEEENVFNGHLDILMQEKVGGGGGDK